LNNSIDYAEVGLKVGLEVHQQLDTQRKMFCNCPAGLYTTTHDGTVLRHMRPTLSELGEYDGTALMEFKTKKNIVYLLHKSNVCTYEMDDTPPFLVNPQAIDIAIEQCLMLGCDIVDEVHIARKQYLDGSIPTGFQRTAIVGVNGRIPFRGREISITQVSVEEDSCREVSDRGHLIVWRTDRLGMPLIETVTGPDLRTPEEVEEAILLIGRVCRSTSHVRVGLGASRQDVNVSVAGGRRVEIKGVPQAWWAPRLVHGEAVRQVNLLKLRDELKQRGFKSADDLRFENRDVTDIFTDSPLRILSAAGEPSETRRPDLEVGRGPFCFRAIKLPGLAGTLSWPSQPDLTFAHEIMGRVRVIACLDEQPSLLHDEKWPDYEGSRRDLNRLRRRMRCQPGDALIAVRGPEEDTLTAAKEVHLRFVDALDGIPNETRQPMMDGTTDFERILPGPDRMYPDTDSPPQAITRDRVERLQEGLSEPPWQREERYSAVGVPKPTIHFLIRRGGARLVDLVVDKSGVDLRWTCFFFGERLKGLRRAGIDVDSVGDHQWIELFKLFVDHPEKRDVWQDLVIALTSTSADVSRLDTASLSADAGTGFEDSSGTQEAFVERVQWMVKNFRPRKPSGSPEQLNRLYMGKLMADLRGQVRATEVAAAVARELEVQS
jgi:glutamyl-tRNA(Gln) amidotransferase subunit E